MHTPRVQVTDATPVAVDSSALARARWLLMGLFALNGLMYSSRLARIPAVRDALGLSTADLTGDGTTGPAVPRGSVRTRTAFEAWSEPRTLLIGVVVMAAALTEGSANDRLSLAVVDGFHRPEAVGAAVFGIVGARPGVSRNDRV